MSTLDWMDFVDPREEAEEFERGSEDMELRAMRLEAEREAKADAECSAWAVYQDYLDATAERGTAGEPVLTFEEFMGRPFIADPAPLATDPSEVLGDDDIPF
jgi:hypothetical protein